MNNPLKVVMIGLGYIGLPTAALMASRGLQVHGVDLNPEVVDTIRKGDIHIVEPELDGLVKQAVESGHLQASTQGVEADVFLIAVPTPFKDEHAPDISYVRAATENLLPYLKEESLIIIESTSPVGTTEQMQALIIEKRPELSGKFFMAYCPERVLPGNVIQELQYNDRVIGGIDETSSRKAVDFYRHFVKGELLQTNARTAEMCKLVENASRDVEIAFANELSMLCDQAEINVWELIKLANHHPRVNILQPGTGVGGHCIAVDPWFIISAFKNQAQLMLQARKTNNYKTQWVIDKIKQAAKNFESAYQRPAKIACMGLTFKDIDDLRESPALEVTQQLIKAGFEVLAVEPNIEQHPELELTDMQQALEQADLTAFLVRHKAFNKLEKTATALDFCGLSQ